MKKLKIILVQALRQFLGIDKDMKRIERDLRAIMEKELERDRQYPVEDKEALPI